MPKISSEAVKAATGKSTSEWIKILKTALPDSSDHKKIAAYLNKNYHPGPWWEQMITALFEQETGRRKAGESADAGFETGVRKTFPVSVEKAWELISSPEGIKIWLGNSPDFKLIKGRKYTTADGAAGVARVINELENLRLTYQIEGWSKPSTIQVRVIQAGRNKTAISFHQENLPDLKAREIMKKRWQKALDTIEKLL